MVSNCKAICIVVVGGKKDKTPIRKWCFNFMVFALQDPLNSGDDVSEQETPDVFDTDNIIVCQYDKVQWRVSVTWIFWPWAL